MEKTIFVRSPVASLEVIGEGAAEAGRPELTTIILPILRQRGLDGLTLSFKRTPAA